MDVTRLYISQEEGIQTVSKAYASFYQNKIPFPTPPLERALRLILQENSFQFNGKKTIYRTEPSWVLKWQFPLPTFMAKVETDILSQSAIKPLVWKRFIGHFFTVER